MSACKDLDTVKKVEALRALSHRLRRTAVEMAHASGESGAHLGGSLSCIEIYEVLYCAVMRLKPDEPNWPDRDRLVSGKEHAVLGQYPAMAAAGLFSEDLLMNYKKNNNPLAGHPLSPELGFDYSCCSLGMALPVAVGMALDTKRCGRDHRVFTVVGDGELDEGSVWEAIMSAAQFRLDNLIAVVDRNGLSSDGPTESIMALENLEDKFKAFGWDCVVVDGHDVEALLHAFEDHVPSGRPYAVIAKTTKGKGLSFAENVPLWHKSVLTDALYEQALRELGEIES